MEEQMQALWINFSVNSSNETSSMRKYIDKVCKGKPKDDLSQKQITSMKTQFGGDSHTAAKVDVKIIRKTIAEMIVIDELPFKHVDGLGFQCLMALAFPKFKLPSKFTVQHDCFVTADNASSNDVAIDYLKEEFSLKEWSILNCKYIHIRCAAHILNLVVSDGLKIKHLSISVKRIRDDVRYVKHSYARLKRFEECMEMKNDGNKAELTLDVPTRRNSTYMMLDAALKHEKGHGVPDINDWINARKLHTFLRHFYEFTVKISGSKYVTSTLFYHELVALNGTLKTWSRSNDEDLRGIACRMQEKIDKYWGDPLKMNKLIFMGAILDPRFKLGYVEFTMKRLYENVMLASRMKHQLKDALYEMFNNYKEKYALSSDEGCSSGKNSVIFSDVSEDNQSSDVSQVWLNEYMTEFEMLHGGNSAKSELDVCLEEAKVSGGQKFDILVWWKGICVRFLVFCQMVRNVLAIPVSTVASESVFSTGGRVLDAFRSSLSPLIAETLLCAQDWLRGSFHSKDVEENDDDQEKLAKKFSNLVLDALSKNTENAEDNNDDEEVITLN